MNKMYQKTIPRRKNAGFTLIELLVVVLIIGVLAAVALPQYQTAVSKARVAEAYVLAKHFKDAEEVYRMANGKYTEQFDELGDVPPGYKLLNDGKQIARGTFIFTLLNNMDRVDVWYGEERMSMTFKLDSLGGGRHCCAYADNEYRAKRLCKSLGGAGDGKPQCFTEGSSGCRCWDLP